MTRRNIPQPYEAPPDGGMLHHHDATASSFLVGDEWALCITGPSVGQWFTAPSIRQNCVRRSDPWLVTTGEHFQLFFYDRGAWVQSRHHGSAALRCAHPLEVVQRPRGVPLLSAYRWSMGA